MFSGFLGAKYYFKEVLKKLSSLPKNRKYFYHFLGDKNQLSLPLQAD